MWKLNYIMLKVGLLSVNEKQKLKMKKNAHDYVDFETEKKMDPKYKTEMCKSWIDTNFCKYGNKCRFAHGKKELFSRSVNANKYKLKECNSFKETGLCMYGSRCNFKHDERQLEDMERSFYNSLLTMRSFREGSSTGKRLQVFQNLTASSSPLNLSTHENSVSSPVSNYLGKCDLNFNSCMGNYFMNISNVNVLCVNPFTPVCFDPQTLKRSFHC
jgi:hypothetical protein